MRCPAVGLLLLLSNATAWAAQPPAATRPLTFLDLRQLSALSSEINNYRDNDYLRQEAAEQVRRIADAIPGNQLLWRVTVKQVTWNEVVYGFENPGRVTVAVSPGPDAAFGHSVHARYRNFPGPPSNRLLNLLGAPKTLLIGSQIPLEVARQLRRGDLIDVLGLVTGVESTGGSGLLGDHVLLVSNVRYDDRYVATEQQ